MSEKEKRRLIKERRGAIAFRMGELQDKDEWHVIMSPYESKADHIMVLGKTPVGATIVRGPESAYKTARLLYGKELSKEILMDIGIMDVKLEPISGGKGLKISFTPDPHLSTTGDISLSKKLTIGNKGKVFPLPKAESK